MRKVTVISALLLTALICCVSRSETDFPGVYELKYDGGKITLAMYKDHTFHESVELAESKARSVSGKWSIYKGGATLELNQVCFDSLILPKEVFPGSHDLEPVHTCLGPELPFGKLRLEVSGDWGTYFTKIQ